MRAVDLRPDRFRWFGQWIIVGSTYHYLPVDDEIPEWQRTTVDVLMAVARCCRRYRAVAQDHPLSPA
jgi:hypothetical protein